MFFQDPEVVEDLFYFNITLGLSHLILELIIIFYLLNRLYIKKEIEERKTERTHIINLITWLLFFLILFISGIVKFTLVFSEASGPVSPEIANSLEKTAIALLYVAFFTKVVYLEYIINKNKYFKGYYFSIMLLIVIIFVLFIDLESIKEIGTLQVIFIILLFLGYSIIPILYLFLAIKTVGKSRKTALKVSIGTATFGIGSLMGPANLKGFYNISELLDVFIDSTYIIGPIVVLIATLVIFSSFWEREKALK